MLLNILQGARSNKSVLKTVHPESKGQLSGHPVIACRFEQTGRIILARYVNLILITVSGTRLSCSVIVKGRKRLQSHKPLMIPV